MALISVPSMPSNATLPALACTLVQLRVVSWRSVASTTPKFTSDRRSPTASPSSLLPPTPTKALPLPPSVTSWASTTEPSASVTPP
ncbi:hypothetical protein HK414_16130 [Ramlibacter terrae]|uniref:Uncharacterized protein n=1 Tax=Ramlibacter terrae TaxID=2732511 RepID=A0ABX6P3M6_9BURK|nr:hypothetical protein HK414_16130 [Ramlibacter terrae]